MKRKRPPCTRGDDAKAAASRQMGSGIPEIVSLAAKECRRRDRLVLVDDENVRRTEEIREVAGRKCLRSGCEVPDDPAAGRPHMSGDGKGGREGDFHLEDRNRRGIHVETTNRCFRQRGIGPAGDGDRVLAALVDGDKGAAGRLGGVGDEIGHNTVANEIVACRLAEGVIADAGRDRDPLRAGHACGSDCLVRTFAAEQALVTRREDRFAGLRDRDHAGDEIDVNRTEDKDHVTRPLTKPVGLSLRHP